MVTEGRQVGAAGSGGAEDKDAKHMFDRIGQQVHEEIVKNGADGTAKKYIEKLKGNLQHAASTNSETVDSLNPCTLVEEYRSKAIGGDAGGKSQPCRKQDVNRFSDKEGAQCDKKKIRDNEDDRVGACAPYRRLHLCNKNMEKMEKTSKTSTDTLLAEVCYAAKFEGQSIKHYSEQYDLKYPSSGSGSSFTTCTMLARSFADIGDIVRGKDLFLGHKQKKNQLEERLQKMFQNIKIENPDLTTLKPEEVREYWWALNRKEVWQAITCDDRLEGNAYFHATCIDGNSKSQANNKCRCKKKDGRPDDQVPTYFDYVPQFLRWFEEWTEDFCRKKNKKLEDVKKYCRNETEKYCSGNGYDCRKTIYKKGKLVIGEHCTNCSVWCRMYETWIDNQKLEFLKQRNKYQTEISNSGSCGGSGGVKGRGRKKRSTGSSSSSSYDNGYEKKFYNKLKEGNYGKVDDFLGLLNNEKECKGISEVKEKIDFKTVDNSLDKNINSQGTFYHSEYCEVCPGCGVKRKDNQWKEKNNGNCYGAKHYNITSDANPTDINVLFFGDKGDAIRKKIDEFCAQTKNGSDGGGRGAAAADGVAALGVPCTEGGVAGSNSDSSLCEPWKCYKHDHVQKVVQEDDDDDVDPDYVKKAGGLCILKNEKGKEKKSEEEPEEFQKTFHDFFYFWIRRFLNDSMYWREKVNSCINNAKRKKCRNGCNDDCECFLKWIRKKETEWGKIVQHFGKQDFGNQVGILGPGVNSPDFVLEHVLNIDELFKDITEAYGNAKELKGIKNMLDEEKKREKEDEATGASSGEDNTTIDKLLQHEAQDAEQCKDCQETQPSPAGDHGARGPGGPSRDSTQSPDGRAETAQEEEEESEEEEEDEDDENDTDSDNDEDDEDEEEEVEDDEDGDDDDYPWYVGPLYHIRLPMNSD